jgi:hypothetical protein
MQISRHWRLNAQRYRMEGFRNANGTVSLRPQPLIQDEKEPDSRDEQVEEKVPVLSY